MTRRQIEGVLLFGLGIVLVILAASMAWGAPVCTTDATTGKVTCKEEVPSTTQAPDPLFELDGQAFNPATGQRLTFNKWVIPACGSMIHRITNNTLSVELTCESGFTITWTITQKR